jgi:hypothetical protein
MNTTFFRSSRLALPSPWQGLVRSHRRVFLFPFLSAIVKTIIKNIGFPFTLLPFIFSRYKLLIPSGGKMLMNIKDLKNPNELYEYLKIEKDLVTGFSILFSRFEYALKRSGYCQKCHEAKPDWYKFAQDHNKLFDSQDNSKLNTGVQYILENPPKVQIVKDGKLDWENRPVKSDNLLKRLVRSIKVVRNNLFHGGKFHSGLIEDPGRNTKLLESCITILKECLSLNQKIQRCFWKRS